MFFFIFTSTYTQYHHFGQYLWQNLLRLNIHFILVLKNVPSGIDPTETSASVHLTRTRSQQAKRTTVHQEEDRETDQDVHATEKHTACASARLYAQWGWAAAAAAARDGHSPHQPTRVTFKKRTPLAKW